jgi:hypothetical protein
VGYAVIDDFRLGQDNRRTKVTAKSGTLWALTNGFINRGGEIEKRKAMVAKYALPAGDTFGAAAAANVLYAFGSDASPTMPAGVTYQRLQHPSALDMTDVLQVESFNGLLYVVAEFSDASIHHFYNGTRVTDWYDGRARGHFEVTGGTLSAGVNKFTSIKVNGVEVLNTAVDHTGLNNTTATAIAAQINSYASVPEYTASAIGSVVYILAAAAAGSGPNGYIVQVTTAGDATIGTITHMEGGQANAGNFTPGNAVRTHDDKMYAISGSRLHFSKITDPTKYTTDQLGAGYIAMANQAAGSEELTGIEEYFNQLAIFAKSAIQIWQMDPDPLLNAKQQVIKNAGTMAPRSILATGRGDGEIAYVSIDGIRALANNTINNNIRIAEIGAPIDAVVTAQMDAAGDAVLERAVSVIEPRDSALWVAIGDKVYVLNQFPSSDIKAWSVFDFGFTITDFVVVGNRLYARSGDTIYLYGGDENDEYDTSELVVDVPFIDGGKPATSKTLTGIDLHLQGTWSVEVAIDPEQPDAYDDVGVIASTTFAKKRSALNGETSHVAFRMTHDAAEFAKLSKLVVHYTSDEAE